jgi:hypothetical protein
MGPANGARDRLATLAHAERAVFAPGAQTLAHLGHDLMSDANAPEIIVAAFLETGEQLRTSGLAELLTNRPTRAA